MAIIYDFIEYKLNQLAERAAQARRTDVADGLIKVLDAYMLGHVDVEFVDGWPVVWPRAANDDVLDVDP
jgi:hypothetical protein